jgi:MFS family permease
MKPSSISRFYVWMNVLNDFAYFGFLILQFQILENVLKYLLPSKLSAQSAGFAIATIASQLIWQIVAEGPTGSYADLFGRARAVAASFYCRAIAVAIVIAIAITAKNGMSPAVCVLYGMAAVLVQILVATGEAFLEGSIEAWLRDEMTVASPDNHTKLVDRTFGISAVAQNVAILLTTATFLGPWHFTSDKARIGLAVLSAAVFVAGGIVARVAASKERFVRPIKAAARGTWFDHIVEVIAALHRNIRHAVRSLLRTEDPAVRRVVVVLVLPFPCWILLSWFYQSFVQRNGHSSHALLPGTWLPWVGLTLASARVAGAWWGDRITRNEEGRDVQRIFERAVAANVAFLFIGGAIPFVIPIVEFPVVLAGALFLATVAAAKGSEEVVKLGKNRLLAVLVADASARATILSLVSTAQNTFAFAALTLAALFALPLTSESRGSAAIMFWSCGILAVLGVLLTAFGAGTRTKVAPPPGPEMSTKPDI